MRKRSDKIGMSISALVIVLIIGANVIQFRSSTSKRSSAPTREETAWLRKKAKETELDDFVAAHGVNGAIQISPFYTSDFTFRLQEEYEGSSLAFYAYLIDIFEEAGKKYVLLSNTTYSGLAFGIEYFIILECPNEIIETLIDEGIEFSDWYSARDEVKVLAYIDSVNRIHHSIRPSGSSEKGYDLYLETRNAALEMKGKCLAMGVANFE